MKGSVFLKKLKFKKSILTIISIILLFGTITYATKGDEISKVLKKTFEKFSGRYYSQDGIIISERSIKDNKAIAKSIDFSTGEPTIKIDSEGFVLNSGKLSKNDIKTKKIKFETDWKGEKEIQFNYIEKGKKSTFLTDYSGENYYISSINNNSLSLLDYNGSIYLLHIKNGEIKKVLNEVGKFNKNEIVEKLKTKNPEEFSLVWGENPQLNIKGG